MNSAQSLAVSIALSLAVGAVWAEGPLEGNEVLKIASPQSRAEVRAVAAEANRVSSTPRGEIIEAGEARVVSKLTREQVIAEAIEARRLGLIPRGNHYPQATPEQAEQIRLAGLRAVQETAVVKSGSESGTVN